MSLFPYQPVPIKATRFAGAVAQSLHGLASNADRASSVDEFLMKFLREGEWFIGVKFIRLIY
jgi:hypothetical protein